jgi:hypothetical protein
MNREQAEQNVRRVADYLGEQPEGGPVDGEDRDREIEAMAIRAICWLAFDIADSLATIAGRVNIDGTPRD